MVLNDCFFGMLCYSNYRNLAVSKQVYGWVFQSFTENLTFSYHILFWGYMNVNSDWKDGYNHKDYSIISHRDVTLILPGDLLKWSIHFSHELDRPRQRFHHQDASILIIMKKLNSATRVRIFTFLKQSVFFLLADKSEKTNQNWRMWNGDSEQGQLD